MQNLLYLLPALVCPLGMVMMGVVMWVMMRGKRHNDTGVRAADQPSLPVPEADRLAMLHAEQDALYARVQDLSAREPHLDTGQILHPSR